MADPYSDRASSTFSTATDRLLNFTRAPERAGFLPRTFIADGFRPNFYNEQAPLAGSLLRTPTTNGLLRASITSDLLQISTTSDPHRISTVSLYPSFYCERIPSELLL